MSTDEVVDLVVKREEGVQISYADGATVEFGLVELRLGCPCAECRSLRDRGEDVWPRPASPIPLQISDAKLHGGWSLNVIWNDGHGSGLYPFDALRRWAEGRAGSGAANTEPGMLGVPVAERVEQTPQAGHAASAQSPAAEDPPDFI